MSSVQLIALPEGPSRVKGDITLFDRGARPIASPDSPVHSGWTEDA